MKKSPFVLSAGMIVAGLLLAGCAKPSEQPTATPTTPAGSPVPTRTATPTPRASPAGLQPEYGGILKISMDKPSDPIGAPWQHRAGTVTGTAPALEYLYRIGAKGEIVPWLATKWEFAPDYKWVTYQLRRGIKFHDGTSLNAQTVKWNLERIWKAKRNGTETWTSIDVVDDFTLRVNLSSYDWTMHTISAEYYVVSQTWYEKMGEQAASWHPIGTGPFKFVSYKDDVAIDYQRFDGYWGQKPYLDGIKGLYFADPTTEAAALQSGTVHIIFPNEKYANDLRTLGYRVEETGYSSTVLFPDSANAGSVYADQKVREAVEYAIDKEAIVKTLMYGFGRAIYQPVAHPDFFGYNTAIAGRKYDPAKAKQLLAQAGYPNGLKTKLNSYDRADRKIDAAIQDYLRRAGIEVQIDVNTWTKHTEIRRTGYTGLFLMAGGQEGGDVISNWNRHLSWTKPGMGHVSTKRPAEWDSLFQKLLVTYDEKTQSEIGKRMSMVAYETVWAIPFYASAYLNAQIAGVHDYREEGKYWWDSGRVWLEKKLH
ncbi:MAG: hypothetical protein HY667_04965 [Chloroflexi bacterium]|nr:hypothetical protein [Chloroflexota bacterium]